MRLTVISQKGGVGKTTTAVNLGAAMRLEGADPLMIDLDPQAQLSAACGVEVDRAEDGLKSFLVDGVPLWNLTRRIREDAMQVVPAHRDLMKMDVLMGKGPDAITRLKEGLDAWSNQSDVIMDCSPYMGVLSINAIFAADVVIVPVASDHLSLRGAEMLDKTLNALEGVMKRRMHRRFLMTRFDARKRMSFEILEKAREKFGEEVCETLIHENSDLAWATDPLRDLGDIYSRGKTCAGERDYRILRDELEADGFLSAGAGTTA